MFVLSSGDEMWRPGGSIDQESAQFAANDNDGWGQSVASPENNPFDSPSSDSENGKLNLQWTIVAKRKIVVADRYMLYLSYL